MQKHVNLVDLVKSFPTNIFLQNLASVQKRTSPIKFAHLAEKSANGSISNLSTKARSDARASRLTLPCGAHPDESVPVSTTATFLNGSVSFFALDFSRSIFHPSRSLAGYLLGAPRAPLMRH